MVHRFIALSAVLVVLLAACGGDDAAVDTETSADASEASGAEFEPMTAGTLTVGTELPAPPFWNGDGYDSITDGYEVDLAREIAERLGLDGVTFVEMPFAGLVAGQECPCDVDFGQVTITDERAGVVDFTSPYFDANRASW